MQTSPNLHRASELQERSDRVAPCHLIPRETMTDNSVISCHLAPRVTDQGLSPIAAVPDGAGYWMYPFFDQGGVILARTAADQPMKQVTMAPWWRCTQSYRRTAGNAL